MKIKLFWFGVYVYSKPFKSIWGFTSRYVSYLSIEKYNKYRNKRWGKHVVEFDGIEFPCFNLYFIGIHWGTMVDRKFAHEQMKKEKWVNPFNKKASHPDQ